jgi:hypothetical protein
MYTVPSASVAGLGILAVTGGVNLLLVPLAVACILVGLLVTRSSDMSRRRRTENIDPV